MTAQEKELLKLIREVGVDKINELLTSVETQKKDDDITYYSTSQAASIIGVTRKTVMQYIQSGKLKATKIGGRAWRISKADVIAFMNGETSGEL